MLSVASGRCAAPLPVGAGEAIPGAADALRNGAHAITIAATSTEMSGIKILLRSRGMLNELQIVWLQSCLPGCAGHRTRGPLPERFRLDWLTRSATRGRAV